MLVPGLGVSHGRLWLFISRVGGCLGGGRSVAMELVVADVDVGGCVEGPKTVRPLDGVGGGGCVG